MVKQSGSDIKESKLYTEFHLECLFIDVIAFKMQFLSCTPNATYCRAIVLHGLWVVFRYYHCYYKTCLTLFGYKNVVND